jgi:hypothetical protein
VNTCFCESRTCSGVLLRNKRHRCPWGSFACASVTLTAASSVLAELVRIRGGRKMTVSVIGTGYVGLTTGLCLAYIGHDVCCVDVDRA